MSFIIKVMREDCGNGTSRDYEGIIVGQGDRFAISWDPYKEQRELTVEFADGRTLLRVIDGDLYVVNADGKTISGTPKNKHPLPATSHSNPKTNSLLSSKP